MRIRSLLVAIPAAALLAAAAAAPALAGAWIPAPKDFYSEFSASTLTADIFHDVNGDRVPLAYGGIREERAFTSTNEFGWKKTVSAVFVVPFASVTRMTAHDEVNRNATGLGDMTAGLKWKFAGKDHNAISLEGDWIGPLGYESTVRLTQGELDYIDQVLAPGLSPGDSANYARQVAAPHIGLGNQNLQGVLRIGLTVGSFSYLDVGGGYRYRYDAPADQILLSAQYGLWVAKPLLLVGTYSGMISSGSGDTPADEYTEHLVNVRAVYRVDDRLDVFGGSENTITAKNGYHKNEIFVGLAMKQTSLNRLQGLHGGTRHP